MPHYFYFDESGDPGLSSLVKASDYFVLAMVQMAVREPLVELATTRRSLYLPETFEFKYHNAERRPKAVFFKAIQPIPFRVRVVTINKARLDKYFASMSGPELTVEFITRLTLRASELDIAGDVLVMDAATPALVRSLRIRLSAECRASGRVRPFSKIVGSDSYREDGLQLADMVAGAVRHYLMGIEQEYYESFANKIVDLWTVPARK